MRSKSYLGAYLRRQRSWLGAPKAITAADKLARIVYHLMRYGVAYMKQAEAAMAGAGAPRGRCAPGEAHRSATLPHLRVTPGGSSWAACLSPSMRADT